MNDQFDFCEDMKSRAFIAFCVSARHGFQKQELTIYFISRGVMALNYL